MKNEESCGEGREGRGGPRDGTAGEGSNPAVVGAFVGAMLMLSSGALVVWALVRLLDGGRP